MMDQRRPPEYILEVFADPTYVKDIIKGAYRTVSMIQDITKISIL